MAGSRLGEVVQDQNQLALLLKKTKQYEEAMCDALEEGRDFVVRLEVRGNEKGIVHARVYVDDTERPVPVKGLQ